MAEENCPKCPGKGMAITALIMGIISIIFCWIPFLNIVGYFTETLGIIFGIIGLCKKQGAMALVGLILSALAWILPLCVYGALFL